MSDDRDYLAARSALADEGDRQRAIGKLIAQRISRERAAELIDQVQRDNIWANRKTGFYKLIGGAALGIPVAAVIISRLGHGRIPLFLFILAAVGLGSCLWGLLQVLIASGREIQN